MIEPRIHEIWSRELDLQEFSDHDDFFDLGGHSLIMTKIRRAIAEELQIEVPIDQLFRHSTVADVCTYIESQLAVR